MFKLTELALKVTNFIFKHATLILCSDYILLGIWVFFFPAELSRNAGIAWFMVGVLFGLLILRKKKRI